MQVLKALVIVMGILIIAGITVIGTTIFNRAGGNAEIRRVAPASFGARSVNLPPGSTVEQVTIDDGRVVVWVKDGQGRSRIIVLDARSGGELGAFELEGAP